MCRQTLPESDAPVGTSGQDPGVWTAVDLSAHTHICIQPEAQQEAAEQSSVVLTVSLRKDRESWVRIYGWFGNQKGNEPY